MSILNANENVKSDSMGCRTALTHAHTHTQTHSDTRTGLNCVVQVPFSRMTAATAGHECDCCGVFHLLKFQLFEISNAYSFRFHAIDQFAKWHTNKLWTFWLIIASSANSRFEFIASAIFSVFNERAFRTNSIQFSLKRTFNKIFI